MFGRVTIRLGIGTHSSLFFFLLFCCLVLYLYLLLLHFGQKKRIPWFIVALVNVPVKAFYWRWLTADKHKHDVKMTSRTMEQHLYGKPNQKQKAKWNLFLEILSTKIA